MARKTNETKARELCALHNVNVDYEAGNGVELWGRDTHTCTDAGVHSDYFPRENYRSEAAMWADVATVAATFKPCADDCDCRAMTICGVCGNAGNVADFMETHTCVSRETPVSDSFPTCNTCRQWEELCACMETTICPVCGSFIDYCLGHGDIGDPRGADIANSHDDNDHSRCHWRADCSPRNYWGTLKADVSDDHCPLCERGLPYHYSICTNSNNNN